MLELSLGQVELGASPKTKQEAIRQVARLLIQNGNIDPRYVDSMFEREKVANTYLANGIAIPHGLPENRELVLKTGIAVLQVPEGVEWNEGEIVRLIVGIAAASGEHLGILRKLTGVVSDEEEANRLAITEDKLDIIESLTGMRPETPTKNNTTDFEKYFDAIIVNPTGLHARPATELVNIAKRYQAQVRVRSGDLVVDAKSLINLLKLGAAKGVTIRVSAEGVDADEALESLRFAIKSGLGEEEQMQAPLLNHDRLNWSPKSTVAAVEGVPASDGIVVGPICQHLPKEIKVDDSPSSSAAGKRQFKKALDAAHKELTKLYDEVKVRLGSGQASIFLVHAEFLQDDELLQETEKLIEEKHNAAWAWQQTIQIRIDQLKKLDDPVLAGRAMDLSDVCQRVLRHMLGIADESPSTSHIPSVLIADDLTPSDTANLDPDLILGFITAKGGPTSHTAIIARAMGIPAIVAAGESVLEIENHTNCILDGFNGKLYLNPSAEEIESAQELHEEVERQLNADYAERLSPAVTTDGHEVEIFANVNRVADAVKAIEYGAEGVGLMRTEFLFLESGKTPTEDEQYEVYRDMAKALNGAPLTIRTLDIGGDKQVPHLDLPKEDNSFLGIRGIRLCFARPDLFLPQLRAVYRAAKEVNIRIMFPMISTLEDVEQVLEITEKVRAELNAPKIEIGIMVEVPSAAILADHFAKLVDFFSIGTNDLTQYTLAMDRVHPQLAKQADALNPAVLRMVDMTVKAATKEGKWVAVCGGAASDTKGASILVGLGVKELSVTVPTIPTIKAHLRKTSLTDLQALAQTALACRTAAEVRAL
ncbi:MAG: phosphoenolpyruvate--protein phosphotransferase [Anaerolineales bacterium]|nr:phosphoenolpyruvate--protein phosphotransferase [Anaerolineales bacterium]